MIFFIIVDTPFSLLYIIDYKNFSVSNNLIEATTKKKLTDDKQELIKLKGLDCSFFTYGYLEEGFCTFFGSCRVANTDYMYKGGCGELSLWGEKKIEEKNVGI